VDEEYAKSDMFHKIIVHGMWGGSLISTLLGTRLRGPGTICLGQTLRFIRPVALGDIITVSISAAGKDDQKPVPVILTSRADTVLARMPSCAAALVVVRRATQPASGVGGSVGVAR